MSDQSPEPMTVGAGIDFADPSSGLAAWYMRSSQVVAVAVLAAVFVLLCYVPLWHTDIWGHLRFGQWIAANGALPQREPFTPFSDPEAAGARQGWGSQLLFYLVFRGGELLAQGDHLRQLAGGLKRCGCCWRSSSPAAAASSFSLFAAPVERIITLPRR